MTGSFRYRAADAGGHVSGGFVDARGPAEAIRTLGERGLAAIEVAPAPRNGVSRIASTEDLVTCFRSLAALVSAGLPLDKALGTAATLTPGRVGEGLERARGLLSEGSSLADALSGQAIYPADLIGVLRAGERAGRLTETLVRVADHLERDAEIRARLRAALAYPAVLMAGGAASLLLIILVVIPRFARLLGDVGQQLPPAARLLMAASPHVGTWLQILILIAAAGAIALMTAQHHYPLRLRLHGVLLTLPLIGQVRFAVAGARFLRTLGTALEAGNSLRQALPLGREAALDTAIAERVRAASALVDEGRPLSWALAQHRALPLIGMQLLALGESTGQVEALARKAADLLDDQASRTLQQAVKLVEPLLIVLLGGAIAFVAGALLQAVYSLRPAGM